MGLVRTLAVSSAACALWLAPSAAHAGSVVASRCGGPPLPQAGETQCERAAISVSKLVEGKAAFNFDTGWVPANSPVQVRLICALHDRTQVDLAGDLDATWPEPITLTPRGMAGHGSIMIDEGFELSALVNIDVNVGGQNFKWTGPIPLPYVTGNLNLIATATKTFDPWAWKGGDTSKTTVLAQAKTQKIAQVPLTQSIISIPGISGGFQLDGSVDYTAWYDTLRIAFDEVNGASPIPLVTPQQASTRLLISPSPSFDTNVFIHGEVTRQMTLHFVPALYFQILTANFALPLADLPLPLPASAPEPFDFDPVPVHVPLPEISIPNANVDVGTIPVNVGTDEIVNISNIGEEILAGNADTLAPIAEVDTPVFSISPKQSAGLKLLLLPQTQGPFDILVHLGSNDPLTPDSYIHVTGVAGAPGVGEAAGCGCRTAPASSRGPWFAGAVAFLALLRRKRKAS